MPVPPSALRRRNFRPGDYAREAQVKAERPGRAKSTLTCDGGQMKAGRAKWNSFVATHTGLRGRPVSPAGAGMRHELAVCGSDSCALTVARRVGRCRTTGQ